MLEVFLRVHIWSCLYWVGVCSFAGVLLWILAKCSDYGFLVENVSVCWQVTQRNDNGLGEITEGAVGKS